MKFQIDSVQACNHAWRVEDRFEEMLKLYPYLKDKITELPDDNRNIITIEINSLEELMQLIDKFNCDVIVGKSVVEEYAQYNITGKIIIYDDYIEDKWRVRKYED